MGTRNLEALWLLTSKLIARKLDTRVVQLDLMGPLAADLEMRNKTMFEVLFDRTKEQDVWTRA